MTLGSLNFHRDIILNGRMMVKAVVKRFHWVKEDGGETMKTRSQFSKHEQNGHDPPPPFFNLKFIVRGQLTV